MFWQKNFKSLFLTLSALDLRNTWLGLRIKKGTGMGASTELGQSSSAMSASESRKPPPKTKQHHSHVTSFGPLDNFIVKKELPD